MTPLAPEELLKEAVTELGGRVVDTVNPDWPSAVMGDATVLVTKLPRWRVTWNGWRGGVIPFRDKRQLHEDEAIALAPLLAAAACAAEVFAYHARDHAMAGRRSLGLSLWNPGADWLANDPTESATAFLSSRLWIIGLGNLGQAFAWLLASLPYGDRSCVELVLNDFDDIALSNESTSLLSRKEDIGRRKARVIAEWLEVRSFRTFLKERRFGEWIVRAPHEPSVALCGVDNALARAALEKPGFGLVVEAGLGEGRRHFEAFQFIHSPHPVPPRRFGRGRWAKATRARKTCRRIKR
jgi:hypothetical protein